MRYNAFHQIHKGLRALLYETGIQLQHADFWNAEETDAVIERITEVVRLFEEHADKEDAFVFPAIEKYDPAIADAFEREHVKDHLLGHQLSDAIAACKAAPVITEKAQAGFAIHRAYEKFMAFNLEHMAKEEEILNRILWRHYTDEELLDITRQIIAHVPADSMQRYNKWMMRGLNNAEISRWLKTVEKTAPEPVFQELFSVAEKELSQKRFRLVLEGMTQGVMLA